MTGRRGDRRPRPDAGVSLVELLVAAAVGSVVLVGVGTVAVGALTASRTIAVRSGIGADSRLAGEALTRSLRTAVRPKGEDAALIAGTATGVRFYALLNRSGAAQTTDAVPSLVELGWDGGCVTRRITPGVPVPNPSSGGPYWTWTPGGAAVCLVRTTTAPAYSYYAVPVVSSGGVDTAPVALTAGALGTSDLATVQSVQVALTVVAPNHPEVPGASLLSRVTLTNVLTDTGGE